MQDFDLEQKLIEGRLRRFGQQQYEAPQGRMVGRHFVAPNAFEHIAAGLRGYGGIKGQAQAEAELKDLNTRRQQALADTLRTYGEQMTGAPEQRTQVQAESFDAEDAASLGPNANLTAVSPARAPNPMAAYSALLNAPDANLRQVGMKGLTTTQQQQAEQAKADAKNREYMGILASAASPQAAMAAGVPVDVVKSYYETQNLGQPQVARTIETVDARGRKVIQQLDARGNPVGQPIPAYVPPRAPSAPRAPNVIQTANGPMILNPDGTARPIVGADGQPVAGTGGAAKPPTEFQGKSGGYGARMQNAHNVLLELEERANPFITSAIHSTGLVGNVLAGMAGKVDEQKVLQAQRDFINAVLRQESGAAIAESEFDNARKQYFPSPGDSPEVLAQKRANREQAIRNMEVNAGASASLIQENRPGPTPQNAGVRAGQGGTRIRFDAQGNIIP